MKDTEEGMLSREKVLEILKKEYLYLSTQYGVKRIGLFGSYAKGNEQEDSDIDLLIEFENPIGLQFVGLAEYIEKAIGKRVEIITLEGIKGIRIPKIAEDILNSVQYV